MDRVRIRITSGVVGDDGTDWLPGTEQDATPAFAKVLFARSCAVPLGGAAPELAVRESSDPPPGGPHDPGTGPTPVPTSKKGKR